MRTRCFDHIDLRVKNLEVAIRFYGQFLPRLGFVRERHEPSLRPEAGGDFHTFYSAGTDKPSEFFVLDENKNHQPNGTRIAFWAVTRDEVDRIAELVRQAGGKIWKARKSVPITARAITRSSSKTLTGTNWKSAAVRVRSFPLSKTTRQLIACMPFVV
jgi:catechol 2,3-dioxygenase-like lactoylglutathione lyase family enzyme